MRAAAHPVMRHRVFSNFHADAEGMTSDSLVDRLLETVKESSADDYRRAVRT